ncbi:MAG: hypothetical protein V2J65_05785 [Desulfobacteraceae bacterium]|jgi:hypothetical protein|nr:hypothetical protein [Desulfobacteraceae bacterium]
MLKKSLSIVIVALFVFSFIAVATLSAEEGKITGTVMSVNVETGEMVVKDDAGEMKSLMADPKVVDLKVFKEGDMVVVESDENGAVKSLEVSK